MDADTAWATQQNDVFNVVADIDLPSARIQYAFLAGYCAAMNEPLPQASEPAVCGPCQAGGHDRCYYWERRRSWAPCRCTDVLHEGKPVPVYGGR